MTIERTTTMRRTYGYGAYHAEFEPDPTTPNSFFAQAVNRETGERRELETSCEKTAREFCIGATDPESAAFELIWTPARRNYDAIETEANATANKLQDTCPMEPKEEGRFVAGFICGYRDGEVGTRSIAADGLDDPDWLKGYRAGLKRFEERRNVDSKLENRYLANIRSFKEPHLAYDAMRADVLAFLDSFTRFFTEMHERARGGKSWPACGDLGHIRQILLAEAIAFGLINDEKRSRSTADTKKRDHRRLYAVQSSRENGRQLPTFYLDADVQGLTDKMGAVRVALDILEDDAPIEPGSICVVEL